MRVRVKQASTEAATAPSSRTGPAPTQAPVSHAIRCVASVPVRVAAALAEGVSGRMRPRGVLTTGGATIVVRGYAGSSRRILSRKIPAGVSARGERGVGAGA